MSDSTFTIRTMTADEVSEIAVEWATREGWNPGLGDGPCFHAADGKGFLLGELDGEPIGCISAVAYEDSFGFLGFYIVKPGFRGKGYGMKLWRAALEHLGDRNIGLDGVIEQEENYIRDGFGHAYRNVRYRGVGTQIPAGDAPHRIVPLSDVDFETVRDYDSARFPTPRTSFLREWIAQPGAHALAALDDDGALIGYGMLRPCHYGYKIGPLFADDAETAEALFTTLAGRAGDAEFFIDVPDVNEPGTDIVKKYGLTPVFETARMYSKGAPQVALDTVFGTTTLELG